MGKSKDEAERYFRKKGTSSYVREASNGPRDLSGFEFCSETTTDDNESNNATTPKHANLSTRSVTQTSVTTESPVIETPLRPNYSTSEVRTSGNTDKVWPLYVDT